MRFEFLIGLRYLRARRRERFVSLIAIISLAGVTIGTFALTVALSVMSGFQEDLRNRLISLVGHGRLTHTTKALDDAGQRISRYLVMQLVINACFGLILGVGLMAIGLPYAFLWGFLAGALRYLPYIGTWLAALPPILLSLAVFDGWIHLFRMDDAVRLVQLFA